MNKSGCLLKTLIIIIIGQRTITISGSHVPPEVEWIPPTALKMAQSTRMAAVRECSTQKSSGLTSATAAVHEAALCSNPSGTLLRNPSNSSSSSYVFL